MEDELKHYGVLGMKWGIRKNPDRAYSKASNKLRKLDTKVTKRNAIAQKKYDRYTFAESKAWNNRRKNRANRLRRKSFKASWKAEKSKKKAMRWYKTMEKTFSNVTINNQNKEDVELGKMYAEWILSESHGTTRRWG